MNFLCAILSVLHFVLLPCQCGYAIVRTERMTVKGVEYLTQWGKRADDFPLSKSYLERALKPRTGTIQMTCKLPDHLEVTVIDADDGIALQVTTIHHVDMIVTFIMGKPSFVQDAAVGNFRNDARLRTMTTGILIKKVGQKMIVTFNGDSPQICVKGDESSAVQSFSRSACSSLLTIAGLLVF